MIKTLFSLALGRPILAVWSLTNRCNYNCLFCNIYNIKSKEMDLDEIEKTIKKLKKIGITYTYLQGGEPLLRKDIIQILKLHLDNNIKPTLITNGSLLDQGLINFIKNKDINLSISLSTLDPELHFKITQNNSLGKVISFIEYLKGIKHKGNWSITTTITRMNYKEAAKIEEFAVKNNFMYAIRPYMYGLGDFSQHNKDLAYGGSLEDIIRLYEFFKEKALRKNYLAYLVYKDALNFLKRRYNRACDAITYSIIVNSDGSVSPCLENPGLSINASPEGTLSFLRSERVHSIISLCHKASPCFHGCGRNIGILMRNKVKIAINSPKIIYLLFKYNCFW